MKVVFLAPSVTSSSGNSHATSYRALIRALTVAGHEVVFLERDVASDAAERDLPEPPCGTTHSYRSATALRRRFGATISGADLVVVGSCVPDGADVARFVFERARGVTAFYDMATPVTLATLERGDSEYLSPELIPLFDLYLSSTGGPTLQALEEHWGARSAHAFYCLVDPKVYAQVEAEQRWDLGYLETYSDGRQPQLEELLIAPARLAPSYRFAVAGPQYPPTIAWPPNVELRDHIDPARHAAFYGAQRFALSVTSAEMRQAGWSPSGRLFEAAACAVPVISDRWPGIDDIFIPGEEILVADSADDVVLFMTSLGRDEAAAIGRRARERVLAEHTGERRVAQLEALTAATGAVSADA